MNGWMGEWVCINIITNINLLIKNTSVTKNNKIIIIKTEVT